MSDPIVTVWSYIDPKTDNAGPSGWSPADADRFVYDLELSGHAITTDSRYERPWNHHMIGVGVGHDDAIFAETGGRVSMAAYYENGEAFGGRWWENTGEPFSTGVKYYGCRDLSGPGRYHRRTEASEAIARQAS